MEDVFLIVYFLYVGVGNILLSSLVGSCCRRDPILIMARTNSICGVSLGAYKHKYATIVRQEIRTKFNQNRKICRFFYTNTFVILATSYLIIPSDTFIKYYNFVKTISKERYTP